MARRVLPFPAPPRVPEEVVSDTIVFEVGRDRFALKWSAEIEQLAPAPADVVKIKTERK